MNIQQIHQEILISGVVHIAIVDVLGDFVEGVYVTEITNERVKGYFFNQDKKDYKQYFNVKHNGEMFRQGTECGSIKYFFKNANVKSNCRYDVISTVDIEPCPGKMGLRYFGTNLTQPEAWELHNEIKQNIQTDEWSMVVRHGTHIFASGYDAVYGRHADVVYV